MKKILNLLLFSTLISNAQVGIGTPAPSATLDITALNPTGSTTNVDGILIPRVDRQRAQGMLTVPVSTIIYVNSIATGSATGQAINITSIGFYYFDGTTSLWTKLATGTNNDWSLTGNAGTAAGTNFIGTTDNTDIRFKTGVASTDRWNISHTNNGQLQSYSLGTAALPTYSWQPDTNTGIWSPLADNIAMSTAGLERTRILANGDMGIGTTVPSHRLSVKNDIANAGVMCIENANSAGFTGTYFSEGPFSNANYRGHIGHVNSTSTLGGPGIFQIASGDRDMVFSATNGSNSYSEQVRIENTTGNVGIKTNPLNLTAGIPLPTSTLHVNGSLAIGVIKVTVGAGATTYKVPSTISKLILDASGGSTLTVELPDPTTCTGRLISVSRGTGTKTITIDPVGASNIQNLDGTITDTTSLPLHSAAGTGINIQFWSDGVNWYR